MSNESLKNIVFSQKVVEFVAVASEFCHVVETASKYSSYDLVDLSRKLLPLLYFKASLLPAVSPLTDDEPERFVTELDYNVLQQKWMQKLGEYDSFYEVFDPEIQFGSETVTSGISENILDIYQELKDFVTAYSIGNEEVMNDSLANCILHFRDFWGQRLVNVLRALHQLIMSDIEWDDLYKTGHPEGKKKPYTSDWVDRFFGQNND
jgi:hypothetical protein